MGSVSGVHFEAVLTGIAGAGDEIFIDKFCLEQLQMLGFGLSSGNDLPNLGARVWPLDSDHGEIAARGNYQARCKLIAFRLHPRHVLVRGARIHDHAKMRLSQEINDEIVYYSALGIKHAGVERFPRLRELVNIIGDQSAQESARILAFDIHGEHVRNVKHASVTADLMMFIQL